MGPAPAAEARTGPAPSRPGAVRTDEAPLEVTIASISPSTVPRRGPVTVSGTITNRSRSTWNDLNVYLLTSPEPMTTVEEVQQANESDATDVVGARITGDGLYQSVGELAPGESAPYLLSVPRDALGISGGAGVYWLGVHVLGTDEDGHDGVADGRARTYLPLMAPRGPSAALSLVLPFRSHVRRHSDGSLAHLRRWDRELAPEGRLGRLLELVSLSGDAPVSLVVDPALVDAARSRAEGDPPIRISSGDEAEDPAAEVDEPDPDEPADPPPDTADGSEAEEEPDETPEAQQAARWLADFTDAAQQRRVLTVPYGDLDVSSALRHDLTDLHDAATEMSTRTLENLGIGSQPVVAPLSGYLAPRALSRLDTDARLILGDRAAPEADPAVIDTRQGHTAVLTDSAAAAGGPSPTPALDALAVRQRVLAEAAVRALDEAGAQPLVVSLPPDWNPGATWRSADFFGGLEVPWLRLVSLSSAEALSRAGHTGRNRYDAPLEYPRAERRSELPTSNLLASNGLRRTGQVLAGLLTRNDTVDQDLAEVAVLASSAHAREHPRRAAAPIRAATDWIRARLGEVTVEAPTFVTMSSEEGAFAVTVVNQLEEPVTVGIEATSSDPALEVTSREPVSLGPGQRASVRLRATAQRTGVYSVTLVPVTADGDSLGTSARVSLRSSQVGLVIWVLMAAGGLVLFVTAGIRIAGRIRERRSGPTDRAGSEAT